MLFFGGAHLYLPGLDVLYFYSWDSCDTHSSACDRAALLLF